MTSLSVLVLDMQPVDPPIGGGRLRLFGLYHDLGPESECVYVGSYDWAGEVARDHWLSPRMREIDVPLDSRQFALHETLRTRAGGKVLIDTTFAVLGRLSTALLDTIRVHVATADVVVFSHPWLYPLCSPWLDRRRQLIAYDAQNVEGILRAEILDDDAIHREVVKCVVLSERSILHDADLVIACSEDDRDTFCAIYGTPIERIHVFPNGVFVNRVSPPTRERRAEAQRNLAVGEAPVVFIGSNYQPNIDAAKILVDRLASSLPDSQFIICGGVGESPLVKDFARSRSNVLVTGLVDENRRLDCLHASVVAVNPMVSGSGTNIKMFDYMASGLPVLSTPIGARGITAVDGAGIRVASVESLAPTLVEMLGNPAQLAAFGAANRRWVEADYAWERISPRLGALLRSEHARKRHDSPRDAICSGREVQPAGTAESVSASGVTSPRRVALMSSFGVKCGIAEYARTLIGALGKQGRFVDLIGNATLDGGEGWRSLPGIVDLAQHWVYDNVDWVHSSVDVPSLLAQLADWRSDVLHLQYHPAFFPQDVLLDVVRQVSDAGMRTALTLHNASHMRPEILAQLGPRVASVSVHTLRERQAMQAAGITRVSVLPFGIEDVPDRSRQVARELVGIAGGPVVATFGFARPHKGVLELIRGAALLRELHPGLRVIAATARYPTRESEIYLEQCRREIDRFALAECVTLDDRFLPLSDVIPLLQAADLLILPYADSVEGASAAAATCLAARRPLVLSRAKIFDFCAGVAHPIDDIGPEAIALGLGAVLAHPDYLHELEMRARKFAEQNSWQRVASLFWANTVENVE